ncbi:MAG: hypothetical protein VKI81_10915, partial [Synechococcaceae cyanobacterium]|nr:hypothetical protein [Synechococcaceae cyanobacterium]
MGDSRLIKSTALTGVRPLGVQGQQVIDAHRQLTAVVRSRLGPEVAAMFARPERASDGASIDWYSEYAGEIRPLSDLATAERQAAEEDIGRKVAAVRALGQTLAAAEGGAQTIGEMLLRAVTLPDPEQIHLVGNHPVLVLWGFEPEGEVPGYVPDLPPVQPAAPAPSMEVAALGAGAEPGGAARGWLRWLLLLPLLALLLFLALRACQPLPPKVVERQ